MTRAHLITLLEDDDRDQYLLWSDKEMAEELLRRGLLEDDGIDQFGLRNNHTDDLTEQEEP